MKRYLRSLLLAALMAALCFSLAACRKNTEKADEEPTEDDYQYMTESIESGTSPGTFSSVDLDGNEVTESIFTEKDVTVLNIWGTYCGPCKEEMPELAKLDEEFPDNVQIIGIVIDVFEGDSEMIGTAKKICQDTGVSYTNIIVNESLIDLLDGIEAIPTTFIVDSEGKAICEPIIGADVNAYKTAVTEYLEQMEK